MSYIKPEVKSYTACGIIEELGPGQIQYTATLNPTGENGAVEGSIRYLGGEYTVVTGEGIVVAAGEIDEVPFAVRGFVGFDISSIHSTVVSATLKIYQGEVDAEPFEDLGNIIVDHIDFGGELETDDYNRTALAEIGAISTNATLNWKPSEEGLDVTQYIQDDLDNNRSTSQFRLRFSTEVSDAGGVVSFADHEGNVVEGKSPELHIEYQ